MAGNDPARRAKRRASESNSDAESSVSDNELPPLDIDESDSGDSAESASDLDSDNEQDDEDRHDQPSSPEGFDSDDLENLVEGEDEESDYATSDEDVSGSGKRPEIDPHYSSDDSDQEEPNTIGNVPISAYETMPHIGYDIDGKRIMRPATQSAIDSLLDTIELPSGWTGLVDKGTGGALNLSPEEQELVDRVQKGLLPSDAINPFEDQIEWFTGHSPEQMPLTATPEPKRRFVPSKHEAKKVMKLVHAIRTGKLVPGAKPNTSDEREMVALSKLYDVWENETPSENRMHLAAPKMAPPTHEESYNPPEEYLMTPEEQAKWEATPPAERETNFIPAKYGSLRKVPGYVNALRERFERCLDLYLAPRMRKQRLNIDPDSLIPELPSPQDLRPFPVRSSVMYRGHVGRIRCLDVAPSGEFLATGGEDGSVRIWEVLTGRELWRSNILADDTYSDSTESAQHPDDRIDALAWHPSLPILAVAAGDNVYLVIPPGLYDLGSENTAGEFVEKGWSYALQEQQSKKKKYADWTKPGSALSRIGCHVIIRCSKRVRRVHWHSKGDYFVTVSPDAQHSAVLVHQVSRFNTQSPFRRSKGLVQDAKFHPFRPQLWVASQRFVRVYDLAKQTLVRRLQPGVRWLATFDIHPQGDNVIMASFDKRVTWHDLELNDRPYKTLRYHNRAVRDVRFHPKLPLFCSAADDGHINVLHGSVYDDLLKNPLLVPLKVLKGHKVTASLGVIQVAWHPREAWLFSAGGDGTAQLWTT